MSLIDIRKLNAEVDALIARQDEEVKAMEEKRQEVLDVAFMWMITDLAELHGAFLNLGIDQIEPQTEIFRSAYNEKLRIRFSTDSPSSVLVVVTQGNSTYIIERIWIEGHRATYDRTINGCCSVYAIMELVLKWREQYPVFKRRFEEECIKQIRRKAETANARYEAAQKALEEVM